MRTTVDIARRIARVLSPGIERLRASVTGRYGFAVAMTALSLLVRARIGSAIHINEAPFLFTILSVSATAWFGGWGPGVVHTILLAVCTQVFFVVPEKGLQYILGHVYLVRLFIFIGQSVFLSVVIDKLVRSRREVQYRSVHQDLRIGLMNAIFSAGSDRDVPDAVLRVLVRELDASAGIGWKRGALDWEIVATCARPEADDSASEVERSVEVRAFLAARAHEHPSEPDVVGRSEQRFVPIVERDVARAMDVRCVLVFPVLSDGKDAPSSSLVFELRGARPFPSDPGALQSLSRVGDEITQWLRARSAERAVNVLSERLVERAQELQAILDTAPIGIAVALGDRCDEMRINASGIRMLGLEDAEQGQSREQRSSALPVARELCEGPIRTAIATRKPVGPIELEFEGDDGSVRTIYESALPFLDAQGKVRGCVGAFVDISAIRSAERAIREREHAFRRSFECAGVGKAQIDPVTGRLQLVNRRLCEMFAASSEELTGRTLSELLAEHERERANTMLSRILDPRHGASSEEYEFRSKRNAPVFAATSITADFDARGRATHLIAVIQDVTDRKYAEEELSRYRAKLEELVAARTAALEESHQQLRLSERMAALGTMSAGLGHDMGNLLLPVRLRLESMAIKGIPEQLEDDVSAIGKCTEYLQRLANGLRLLSLDPDKSNTLEHTDLFKWWADIESFLKNVLPRGAELEMQFEEGLPLLPISRHRLTQAIFNLVQNASDALKDRRNGWVRISAARGSDGSSVRLTVSDNGTGMTPEIRAHCMEPFFTSKTRGISTGLGLSLVHGMVQQAGGTIDIDSDVTRGTKFVLTLPIASRPSTEEDEDPGLPMVRAIISLDDLRLRAFAATVARSLGCEVSEEPGSGMDELTLANEPRSIVWVADVGQVSPERVNRLKVRSADSLRKVLCFGDSPYAPADDSLVEYGGKSTPSTIRRAIRDTISVFSEKAHRVEVDSGV